MRAWLVGMALLLTGLPALAQQQPVAGPAADGIFDAFQTHPLVGLGETHRRAQEIDFYTALIRDPRFAREVGNVMVEFGGAAHQDIIDRYVAGEDVPYTELRKVWTDTVGWIPAVTSIGYQRFYAQVREINLTLPPQNRIHVWLGEPAIDWSQIKTHADWEKFDRMRDTHAAELIEREILARGMKALLIYGGGHFFIPLVPGALGEKLTAADWQRPEIKALIDRDHPGALFTVKFYTGSGDKACWENFERNVSNTWPTPALAPYRGTALADTFRRCDPVDLSQVSFPPGFSDSEKQQAAKLWEEGIVTTGDALVYLGSRSSLTLAPYNSDYFLDPVYYRELARRYQIQTGQVLPPANVADDPMSPRFANH